MSLSSDEKIVYDWLQDEKSRACFDARKKFAEIPGNTDIIRCRQPEFENYGLFKDVFEAPAGFDTIVEKMKTEKYIVYGAGYIGKRVLEAAHIIGALDNCICIWDKNPNLYGSKIFGKSVVAINQSIDQSIPYILISVCERFTDIIEEIKQTLHDLNIPDSKLLYPYGTLFNPYGMYFDKDIILPSLQNGEVFIDAGCYDFLVSERLIDICENMNIGICQLYAFEPSDKAYAVCIKNSKQHNFVKLIKYGLWSEKGKLCFAENKGASRVVEQSEISIDVVALDSYIENSEKVTFIKMDIEGAELEALKGATEIIKRDKPKLAISIYHKLQDYLDIPLYLKSIMPEYRCYFRHYKHNSVDTVLYCVI